MNSFLLELKSKVEKKAMFNDRLKSIIFNEFVI